MYIVTEEEAEKEPPKVVTKVKGEMEINKKEIMKCLERGLLIFCNFLTRLHGYGIREIDYMLNKMHIL